MWRKIIARTCLAVGLMSSALFAAGCSGAPASEEAESGTLSIPLLASAGEHTYRLQATMYVSGPVYQWIDLSADAEQVSTLLPTGTYYANLWSWSLSHDDGTGNFLPVNATLVSDAYPAFSIFNQTTSTIAFQFETEAQIVTVGTGSLNVVVGVTERPPVCTPLGTDCPEGTWCAPSELTGALLSCIAAGPAAAGDACSSPTDCAANTSCFDLGAGPVCTPLCSSAEFGAPCADGGTCTAQGADYGVCAPTSP